MLTCSFWQREKMNAAAAGSALWFVALRSGSRYGASSSKRDSSLTPPKMHTLAVFAWKIFSFCSMNAAAAVMLERINSVSEEFCASSYVRRSFIVASAELAVSGSLDANSARTLEVEEAGEEELFIAMAGTRSRPTASSTPLARRARLTAGGRVVQTSLRLKRPSASTALARTSMSSSSASRPGSVKMMSGVGCPPAKDSAACASLARSEVSFFSPGSAIFSLARWWIELVTRYAISSVRCITAYRVSSSTASCSVSSRAPSIARRAASAGSTSGTAAQIASKVARMARVALTQTQCSGGSASSRSIEWRACTLFVRSLSAEPPPDEWPRAARKSDSSAERAGTMASTGEEPACMPIE
mmetsp:Transcript_27245/g.67589  ORF Transcript_27245/g.67589 Transcript_27245/m.67589 type:complete len:358 (+) Transcript_27245:786-1859(+)